MSCSRTPCAEWCASSSAAFGWDSCDKGGWYKTIESKVPDLKVSCSHVSSACQPAGCQLQLHACLVLMHQTAARQYAPHLSRYTPLLSTCALLQELSCTHLWLPPPSQSVSNQVSKQEDRKHAGKHQPGRTAGHAADEWSQQPQPSASGQV